MNWTTPGGTLSIIFHDKPGIYIHVNVVQIWFVVVLMRNQNGEKIIQPNSQWYDEYGMTGQLQQNEKCTENLHNFFNISI